MGLKLEKVIPWGRSFTEYVRMFNLTSDELQGKIIDCAGGPASFNAEMNKKGYKVISCDPVYQFSAEEIAQRIAETYPEIISQVAANQDNYVWKEIKSADELGKVRMAAMEKFLADFPAGVGEGRYLTNALPNLPFEEDKFDLALCSHFLFSYSAQLSREFHLEAVREMCRVAKEVRIFPIVNLAGEISLHLEFVREILLKQGYICQMKQVKYEFQKGGNQLLVIK
ncbi:MAG: SAM-dependent methyltransferase [Oscillatoria sp. PMC 1051.18]|nr:SAM-dependent methyltransferase [Oscillatoria sp. PMC 1050.18]MEC5030812.1 SAM-dependent methyltransferase [Oscillatoria sp. PMC 1051.18]